MKNIRKIRLAAVGLLLALSLTMIGPMFASTNKFSDVPTGHWAYQQINQAVADGIVSGYNDGTYRPTNNVTFAHFCAFLARAFYAGEFNDSGASPWYKPYTDVLRSHGILNKTMLANGFDANINQNINRNEMALLMYNIMQEKGFEQPSSGDYNHAAMSIKDYASYTNYEDYRFAVLTCYATGVLNGQSDGSFGGWNLMNRAQAAVVIYRLKGVVTGTGPSTPTTPEQPSTPETPSTPEESSTSDERTLTNGKPITEENVMALLEELKVKYPHMGTYDGGEKYYFKAKGSYGSGCAYLAFKVNDELFGVDAPVYSHTRYSEIKPGDIIECKNETGTTFHWFVVTTVPNERTFIKGVGGGDDGIIVWNESAYTNTMDNEVVWTRYPQ